MLDERIAIAEVAGELKNSGEVAEHEIDRPIGGRAARDRTGNGAGGGNFGFAKLAEDNELAELVKYLRGPEGGGGGEFGSVDAGLLAGADIHGFEERKGGMIGEVEGLGIDQGATVGDE